MAEALNNINVGIKPKKEREYGLKRSLQLLSSHKCMIWMVQMVTNFIQLLKQR